MTRGSARLLHVATLTVGVSGLVFAWMRYLCEPADEFALFGHPWEPATKAWHVIAAPLLVFAVGLVWHGHVLAKLRTRAAARRRTGIVLAASVAPMIVSGYLIQVTVDEDWRLAWVVVHVGTGCGWLLAYAAHQLARRVRTGAG